MAPRDDLPVTIDAFLRECLTAYRKRINTFAEAPEVLADQKLGGASRHAAQRAVNSFLTGQLSPDDQAVFAELSLIEDPLARARAVIRDEIVAGRLALGIVEESVQALSGAETRTLGGFAAWMTLPHTALPPEVGRYYSRVIRLYVAGGTLEVFVLCRSMVEVAMSIRVPDSDLRAHGVKPRFAGRYFAAAQRRKRLKELGGLTDKQWEAIDRIYLYGDAAAHGNAADTPDDPLEVVLLACTSVRAILHNASERDSGAT